MVKDNRQRLFEMMNRVSGMPLIKEETSTPNLPTWASSSVNDFIPLEDYEEQVPCSTNIQEVERDLNPKSAEVTDPIKWLQDKDAAIAAGKKQDVETGGRLSPLMIANARKGDKFNVSSMDAHKLSNTEKEKVKLSPTTKFGKLDYDLEELKKILNVVPAPDQIIGQNGKMGKTNFYNITLPAFKGIYCDNKTGKFYIINVCDKADTCKKVCFAQMGNFVKNDPTVRLNAQKLNYLLNNAETWKNRVINGIKALYDGVSLVVVRWHDSGDFLSEEYMKLAFEVAAATEFAEHYAYSKEVSTAKKLESIRPDNFEFKFSFGGKEDNLIDKSKDAHAVIVPKEVFADLQPDEKKIDKKTKREYMGKGWKFSPEAVVELKNRLAEKYGIDANTIKTHEELKHIPYNKKNGRVWNVIGAMGDSDIAALRRDVLGIYLLVHK